MAAIRRFTKILPSTSRIFLTQSGACFKKRPVISVALASRPFTRSLWCATKDPVFSVSKTNRCGCCGYHTESDAELAEYLTEEIKMEERQGKKLPTIDGFRLHKNDGCDVTFEKADESESLRVKFNVNNAMEDESEFDGEQADGAAEEVKPAKIRCKPPFVVELQKKDCQVLHIQCQFPNSEDMVDAGIEESESDQIEITDVALIDRGVEWTENAFSLQGGVMDGSLYDMLLQLMDERGVTSKAVSQLVDFATAYEHKQYVSFLTKLKEFAEHK